MHAPSFPVTDESTSEHADAPSLLSRTSPWASVQMRTDFLPRSRSYGIGTTDVAVAGKGRAVFVVAARGPPP